MIPRAFITEWRAQAPWGQDAWVEQDLVISRASPRRVVIVPVSVVSVSAVFSEDPYCA